MNKAILIGLDGADHEFIAQNLEQFPTLAKITEKGVFGKLRSTIPPLTATAWPALMSGCNPGKTGVFDFVREDQTVTDSTAVRVPQIWEMVKQRGGTSIALNVPVTYPTGDFADFMVSGLLSPELNAQAVHPPQLLEELKKLDYEIMADWREFRDGEAFLKKLREVTEKRFRLIQKLLKEIDWDFFTLVISGTDHVQHFFRKHPQHPKFQENQEIILEYFRYVDARLGELLEEVSKQADFYVVSDHGFGKTPTRVVNLNHWLIQKSYLKPIPVPQSEKIQSQIIRWAKVIKNLPGVRSLYEKLSPKQMTQIAQLASQSGGFNLSKIESSQSQAYFSKIFMNTGTVRLLKGAASSSVEELAAALRKLRDPQSGAKIIKQLWRREELYSGQFLEELPEIVFLFNADYTGGDRLDKFIEVKKPRAVEAGHRLTGILLAQGPRIRSAQESIDAELIDVVPTILRGIGLPPSKNFDGEVLKEILSEEVLDQKEAFTKYQRSIPREEFRHSRSDEAKVKQRLADLGYL